MENLCWAGLGLLCLAIGIVAVGLVLLVLLIVHLLRPKRSTAPAGPGEQVVEGEARPTADVVGAPAEIPGPAQDIVQEVTISPTSAPEGKATSGPAEGVLPEPSGPPPGQWDWPRVFAYLVEQCDHHGGYYALPPEEVARFKNGPVGKGWGMLNLRDRVLPKYQKLYPGYSFTVSPPDGMLRCRGLNEATPPAHQG